MEDIGLSHHLLTRGYGEVLLTIMASLAQQESDSLDQVVRDHYVFSD